jgi:DNA-binding response OmpR family regulator
MLPKAKAERPDVLVIMITAYGDAETKRKALENNAEALLTKPIDFVSLRGEIDTRANRAHEMKAARLRRPRAETEISLSADDREEE